MGLKPTLKRHCEQCGKPQLRFTDRNTVWRWHKCDKPLPGPSSVPSEHRLSDVLIEPGDAVAPEPERASMSKHVSQADYWKERAEQLERELALAMKHLAALDDEIKTRARLTPESMPGAIRLAVLFHETYERLAPQYGYETRPETRVFDASSQNGKLMIAVCRELRDALCAATGER